MASSIAWKKIFDDYNISHHDFTSKPFRLSAVQIKKACQQFTITSEKEVRLLSKQDSREQRPQVFVDNGLFLLPVSNGVYNIVKGEGYFDIPNIRDEAKIYESQLDFYLDTAMVGNSEMQHLDFAYASSLIRSFVGDSSLVLTIRGRKYTPAFNFYVGDQEIQVKGVQTEVDAGYEGRRSVTKFA